MSCREPNGVRQSVEQDRVVGLEPNLDDLTQIIKAARLNGERVLRRAFDLNAFRTESAAVFAGRMRQLWQVNKSHRQSGNRFSGLVKLHERSLEMNALLAYFDPGSGSLLLQVLVGGSAGLFVFARYVWELAPSFWRGRVAEQTRNGAGVG